MLRLHPERVERDKSPVRGSRIYLLIAIDGVGFRMALGEEGRYPLYYALPCLPELQ